MILVRHGESAFNAVYSTTRIDPGIRDPALTAAGRAQARVAGERLARHTVRRVVTSPYTRALETAEIVAAALGAPVTVEPLVRERRGFTCDIGSPRSVLSARWPHLSFAHLDEEWWPPAVEDDAALAARCAAFRETASAWSDWAEVAVVTHWGFLLELTGRSVQNGETVRFQPDPRAAR